MQQTTGRRSFPTYILVFLAPAVIIYTLFMVYPLLNSLRLSFFAPNPQHLEVFVGLQNYVKLFTDPNFAPRFWGALVNNIVFFLVHVLVQNTIGLLLAALLTSGIKGVRFYRTVLFLPTVLSVVIIGFIWQLILNPLWGVAETILDLVGLGFLFKPWLGLPETALVTVSLISVWQWIGIPMILFYTALIGIPDELVEASRVDGATGWDVFWRIKFPLILPTVGIVAILTFVGAWNEFVAGSVMVDDPALKPVQPLLYAFIGYFGREWGPLTAAATLAILPVLAVFAVFGRLIVSGLTKGAVKG